MKEAWGALSCRAKAASMGGLGSASNSAKEMDRAGGRNPAPVGGGAPPRDLVISTARKHSAITMPTNTNAMVPQKTRVCFAVGLGPRPKPGGAEVAKEAEEAELAKEADDPERLMCVCTE